MLYVEESDGSFTPKSISLKLVEDFFRDFVEELDVADDIDELINEYAAALLDELEGKDGESTNAR